MKTPIVRQGRYRDTRTTEIMVLTGWSDKAIVFNGNITVLEDDFYKYFTLVKHED